MKSGIQAKADELGVKVDIFAATSEDDVEGQLTILENAVSKGYKAIGVAPLSPTNLNNVIAQAMWRCCRSCRCACRKWVLTRRTSV